MGVDICGFIKLARSRLDMSQAELSERSGVSQSTISKIESRDGYEPSWETASALADAMGFDVVLQRRV